MYRDNIWYHIYGACSDGDIVKGLMDRVENKEEVQAYIDETVKKSDMDRTELNKTKSGCELKGLHCINL